MLAIELKILLLTGIYFVGWFLFEKVFSRLWESWGNREPVSRKTPLTKAPSMASITPLDQTARYLKGLKNPDWRIRRISAVQLGDKRGTSVVQGLIEALNDPREEVSLAAGEALAKIGDPQAIAALSDHCNTLEKRMDETYERLRAA
ncbi:MAG TPA: HEAT repeat domain-containing protein [Candidatus Ozemobacteraceae bacterium]|nr:HEAT repeat domain-containing protein [Candidatus Ozemobacteraceae bacterium]